MLSYPDRRHLAAARVVVRCLPALALCTLPASLAHLTVCGDVSCIKGKEIELKIGDTVSIKLEENQITLKVGDTQIVLTQDTISLLAQTIETVGKTNLGLDAKRQLGPNVLTLGGVPAKKTFAKTGS